MMKLLSFRRTQTKLFALWTAALTIFFGARVVMGHEGDAPSDLDPAAMVYTTSYSSGSGYSGGGHSSSRGSGSSYSFGK